GGGGGGGGGEGGVGGAEGGRGGGPGARNFQGVDGARRRVPVSRRGRCRAAGRARLARVRGDHRRPRRPGRGGRGPRPAGPRDSLPGPPPPPHPPDCLRSGLPGPDPARVRRRELASAPAQRAACALSAAGRQGLRKTIGPTKASALDLVSSESIETEMTPGFSGSSP